MIGKFKKPSTINIAKIIGKVTFSEIVRDKVLYNSVLCAILLFGASLLASNLTFTDPNRIIVNFGLTALHISCTFIAILIGASMLSRELDRRTIYVVLSKPISRIQFLLGKFSGLVMVLSVNWMILCLVYLASIYSTGGGISETLLWAVALTWVHSVVIAAIVLFFSTFSTTSLSVIITIGFYLVGQNISQMRFISGKMDPGLGRFLMELSANMLPNFERFSLGAKVTYNLPVTPALGLTSVFYGAVMVGIFLLVSGLLIHRKEI